MIMAPAITAFGLQGGDWLVLARLLREDASQNMVACAPSDVTSITRWLVDLTDGTNILSGPTVITVGTAILGSLSTGNVWRLDAVGFNFTDQIAGSLMTNLPGVEVQYKVVLADGTVVKAQVDINLKKAN